MTDEQINAAITQATGLWDCPYSNETKRMYDFCSDLNAMHEAEKVLNFVKFQNYIIYLMEHYPERAVTSARQRAEAFLRTLGKWEEAE